MDNVDCSQSHDVLDQCDFNGWGVNNCGHDDDVGVICWAGLMDMKYPIITDVISIFLCLDEYQVAVTGLRVLNVTGTSITVAWEVRSALHQ